MRLIFFVFCTFFLLHADEIYTKGKELYLAKGCHTCHGLKAQGMHNYPLLANRAEGFLAYKLRLFRDKISQNQQQEMMIPFAVGLDDSQIKALAYFLYNYKDEEVQESYDDSYYTHGDGGS